jgi:protein-tyrosine phosphatase
MRVCFVCLGNICRSPTAEAVTRHLLGEAGLTDRVTLDSAGTGDWHLGEPPDRRTQAAARKRGIDMDHLAQKFTAADFARFDLVLAMDRKNLRDLEAMAPTPADRAKVRMFRSFDPVAPAGAEVPDPYYGGTAHFEEVLDVCEAAARGLVAHLRAS